MILRNPRDGREGLPGENVFEAVEPRTGEVLGSCAVYEEYHELMFPDRPYQVRIRIDAADEYIDTLLGAAFARARALCAAQDSPARIYADCDPGDGSMLALLRQYGFRDNDGLLRMRRLLPCILPYNLPTGCVVVNDSLEDPKEQRYFLERYNELYGDSKDMTWLSQMRAHPDFRRILTVAPTGMAGEILVWKDGYTGVIGFFDTARRWRNMGVAGCMLALACKYLADVRAVDVIADVRAKMPYARRTLEKAGFEQDSLICRYPGIDI